MIQGLAHINRRVLLKSIGLQDYLGAGFRWSPGTEIHISLKHNSYSFLEKSPWCMQNDPRLDLRIDL